MTPTNPTPAATGEQEVDEVVERAAFVAEAKRRGWKPGEFMLGAYSGWLAVRLAATPLVQPAEPVALGHQARALALRGLRGIIGSAQAQARRILVSEGDADDLRQDRRDLPTTLDAIRHAVESFAALATGVRATEVASPVVGALKVVETLRLAKRALQFCNDLKDPWRMEAIEAIETALATPQQEAETTERQLSELVQSLDEELARREGAQPGAQWISVKDRLPANRYLVLAYRPDADESPACDPNNRLSSFDGERWDGIHHVTHWMPLPADPTAHAITQQSPQEGK